MRSSTAGFSSGAPRGSPPPKEAAAVQPPSPTLGDECGDVGSEETPLRGLPQPMRVSNTSAGMAARGPQPASAAGGTGRDRRDLLSCPSAAFCKDI